MNAFFVGGCEAQELANQKATDIKAADPTSIVFVGPSAEKRINAMDGTLIKRSSDEIATSAVLCGGSV